MSEDKRNYGIDLLRIVSMLFIVILHCNFRGGLIPSVNANSIQYKFVWLIEVIAYCAVDIFALITGYVMCDKKGIKIKNYLNLWLEVVFYSFFITLIFDIYNTNLVSPRDYIYSLLPVTNRQWWYFTAYTGLFFLVPFLNKAINSFSNKQLKIMFLFIIILFSFYDTVANAFNLNKGYSLLWIILLYVLGAIIKKCKILNNGTSYKLFIIMIGLYLITYLYKICGFEYEFFNIKITKNLLISYTSPTIVGTSILYILIFSRIKFNDTFKKIISFAAPSAFAVYILNNHICVWNNIMCGLFSRFAYSSIIVIFIYIISFSVLFVVGSILIDKARIKLFKILKVYTITDKIQNTFNIFIKKID